MPTDPSSPLDPQAERRAAYAAFYAEAGDHAAAADVMRQALDIAEDWALGWTVLADYRDRAGDRSGAIEALRRAAALDGTGALGAAAKLAAFGQGEAPPTLPPDFVRGLFDQYAERFERQLRDKLHYRAPEHLTEAILTAGPERFAAALDLGCGTGLMGEALRPYVGRLAGLDLSPRMVAKARAKGVYDDLYESDVLGFEAMPGSFDLVAAADVLNYLGDLTPLFSRVHSWLRPNGRFAFTLEAHAGEDAFVLNETMRYAHSGKAVAALLSDAGFSLLTQDAVELREDRGEGVKGWVFVASA